MTLKHPRPEEPVRRLSEAYSAIDEDRLEKTLRRAFPFGVVACAIMAGFGIAIGAWWLLAICVPGIAGFLSSYVMLRRGMILWAAWAIVVTATALITASATTGAGLRDPGVLAYPVIVVFAGMTLEGPRFTSALAIVALSMTLVVANQALHWVPTHALVNPMWLDVVSTTLIMAATAYAVWLLAQSARHGLATARKEVEQRRAVERELQELLTHDFLTGVFNRRFFDAELARLGKSRRGPVSLIVADIDGLKRTNDRLGHWAGDQLIIGAARLLSASVRAEDILARIGGDEFAILLPETDEHAAREAVTRIEARSREPWTGDENLVLQLSLGSATSTAGSLEEALAVADARMYTEKSEKQAATGPRQGSSPAESMNPSPAT